MMKAILTILSMFLVCTIYAQDPMLQKNSQKLDAQAKELTKTYAKELALNGQQIGLFESKVEEFLIRASKIEKEYSGREKLVMLYSLQDREIEEMDNILTRPQLERYKEMRPKIQPLEQVETQKSKK